MMLELLVSGLCLGNYACDPALKAYYQGNPKLQAFNHKIKRQAKNWAPPSVFYAAPLITAMATDKALHIKLGRNMVLKADNEQVGLTWGINF